MDKIKLTEREFIIFLIISITVYGVCSFGISTVLIELLKF